LLEIDEAAAAAVNAAPSEPRVDAVRRGIQVILVSASWVVARVDRGRKDTPGEIRLLDSRYARYPFDRISAPVHNAPWSIARAPYLTISLTLICCDSGAISGS